MSRPGIQRVLGTTAWIPGHSFNGSNSEQPSFYQGFCTARPGQPFSNGLGRLHLFSCSFTWNTKTRVVWRKMVFNVSKQFEKGRSFWLPTGSRSSSDVWLLFDEKTLPTRPNDEGPETNGEFMNMCLFHQKGEEKHSYREQINHHNKTKHHNTW